MVTNLHIQIIIIYICEAAGCGEDGVGAEQGAAAHGFPLPSRQVGRSWPNRQVTRAFKQADPDLPGKLAVPRLSRTVVPGLS